MNLEEEMGVKMGVKKVQCKYEAIRWVVLLDLTWISGFWILDIGYWI